MISLPDSNTSTVSRKPRNPNRNSTVTVEISRRPAHHPCSSSLNSVAIPLEHKLGTTRRFLRVAILFLSLDVSLKQHLSLFDDIQPVSYMPSGGYVLAYRPDVFACEYSGFPEQSRNPAKAIGTGNGIFR